MSIAGAAFFWALAASVSADPKGPPGLDVLGGTNTDSVFRVVASPAPTDWTFFYGNRKILVYSFAPGKFKPYVKELYTLEGHNILRDAPGDHLHHHGLMYAITVNGLNFWEEVPGSGVEKVIASPQPKTTWTGMGQARASRATFTQVLHWVSPEDAFLPDTAGTALLIEHRTIELTVVAGQQEVALVWTSQFEVGEKTNTVLLTGTKYDGLGMRFQEELDRLAVHSLAGQTQNLAGRQDVSRAAWASVSFDAPGWAATIAMAGHPSNPGGDPIFFSMLTPFAYLSATQSLDTRPLVYHSGDKFQLRYLILLEGAAHPSEALRQRIESWKKETPAL